MFNPAWPPHAKFHDALTDFSGDAAGFGLPLLFWADVAGPGETISGWAYSLAWGLLGRNGAQLPFPGARGLESEFPELVPRIRGIWINERFASVAFLALLAIGYRQEQRDLG